MPKKRKLTRTTSVEKASLKQLRVIQSDMDSPDPSKMYQAVSDMAGYSVKLCLLPKAMDFLTHKDKNVQQAALSFASDSVFGVYVADLFRAMKALNPAEREQTLQSLQERFSRYGGPSSKEDQKMWVSLLETLGREHQPAVFAIMRWLGNVGRRWIRKQLRENTKSISLGAVPSIAGYPDKQRRKLIKLLAEKAAKGRREMLPYICGIVDERTSTYLASFMKGSSWRERVEIAGAIARNGITRTSGLVMQLVGDENWQVKQSLLENLNIRGSKLTSLLRMLDYLVTESHSRVRSLAERTLLMLGLEKCKGSKIEDQRKRLEKKFRPQLLKAANKNKDLDVNWLGIARHEDDPMSEILDKVSDMDTQNATETEATPEGVSLADIETSKTETTEASSSGDDKSALLAALLGAKESAVSESHETSSDEPTSRRFIIMLRALSEKGSGVPMEQLMEHASEYNLTHEELFKTLAELEKKGMVYRSGEGEALVSYADQNM
ncbi:hypothetical protein EU546_03090 [Candidatus Thorarchaeota archaeon]|nr:MAG: hypothetical protein EU546_03090 [Candidatus Thorarchaeota archaeon]